MTLVAFGLSSWLIWRGQNLQESDSLRTGGIALLVGWLYALASIFIFWGAIVTNDADALFMLRYVSWSILSLLLMSKVLALQAPSSWMPRVAATFIVPMGASFVSLTSVAWDSSWTHPHALGLYLHTFILLIAATMVYRVYKTGIANATAYFDSAKFLFIISGFYVIALIWLIPGALFNSDDVAVSIALLIYTIAGLCLYTLGRTKNILELRYAGIVLLTGVVGRLLIVDVWRMAILGRIVTFLGVGFLFISTALFEKPFEKFKN